jgi:methylmalonyl-CoA/ethylmalonyl-CoA epimerase
MLKVEHIGIAVRTLADSVPLFEKLLNSQCYKTELVESEKVNTAFFQNGDTKKKGEGLHHIAFDVENIEAEMERLKSEGFVLLNDRPKAGADNKLICFIHPKNTNGVLIELCQEIK